MTRALRAHTLNEFSVDEANNVATCKVRLMRQRMIFQIKTQFYAYYYTEKIPWNKREVRLKLHISTIEPDSA